MRLHHLAFRTTNLEETLAFYREVFHLDVVRDARPRSVWLGLADGAVLMIERRTDGEPSVPVGSMELVAFRVSESERQRVRTISVERGCFDGETQHTVYVRDPDGRRVGISNYPMGGAPAEREET